MKRMKIKTDIEIWENNVLIRASDTGFTLQVTSDPEQHNKILYFNPRSAESIKKSIDNYILARDTINDLNCK